MHFRNGVQTVSYTVPRGDPFPGDGNGHIMLVGPLRTHLPAILHPFAGVVADRKFRWRAASTPILLNFAAFSRQLVRSHELPVDIFLEPQSHLATPDHVSAQK